MVIHTFKHTIKDTLTTACSSEGAHFANAPSHLDEQSLDDVGRAQTLPVNFRAIEEGQEFL